MARKLTKGEMIGVAATLGIGILTLWLMNRGNGNAMTTGSDNPDTYYLTSNIPSLGGDGGNPGLNFGPVNVSSGCGCDSTDYTTAAGIAQQTANNQALSNIFNSLPPYINVNVQTNGDYIAPMYAPPVTSA